MNRLPDGGTSSCETQRHQSGILEGLLPTYLRTYTHIYNHILKLALPLAFNPLRDGDTTYLVSHVNADRSRS